ncbi:MBL fold metallo-hydrolase [Pseudovibrio sp. Tun.PSC04-5.I4]|uniref:MBL fold metallo-hydrolase n=1 Tax=Pseudovibrio sp. Tun.PSC04-5.I4 TaxID=1798213 RepID=UPI000883EAE7|nr:MBL fold metallo-hydrolase [Pseudovibrio sp. Tun.PSC04-5.I4]SDR34534.1 Glyoxylase, beta-lactamase superfamily II [Pseudovibrio sp. Tun.PSC04-5.I4]
MTDTSNKADFSEVQITVVPVTAFQQNCSIVWNKNTRKAVVVDPGGDVDQILAALKELDVVVEHILITHGHIDHIGGATELAETLGIKIIGPHKADRPLIERVEEQAKQFGLASVRKVEPDQWLEDGDTVTAGGVEFDVLHCPGHAPGHVVFFNRDMKLAISGDVLFAGSVGRTDLPGGDHATLISSIKEKMLPLGDDVTFLPGHGPASTIGEEKKTNPFLK